MDASKIKKKKTGQQNLLESLRDIGGSAVKSTIKDVLTSDEILEQILGRKQPKKYSGEIQAGDSVEINDVYTGKAEAIEKERKQTSYERNLRQEEENLSIKKTQELRLQLKALMNEVAKLASTTQELSQEVKVASMQAPVEPGTYHLIFFEKLLEFIKTYRKKVENASVWLHITNNRAQKKNYWASYKKHGSKFLLSGEHYLTRSAG